MLYSVVEPMVKGVKRKRPRSESPLPRPKKQWAEPPDGFVDVKGGSKMWPEESRVFLREWCYQKNKDPHASGPGAEKITRTCKSSERFF